LGVLGIPLKRAVFGLLGDPMERFRRCSEGVLWRPKSGVRRVKREKSGFGG